MTKPLSRNPRFFFFISPCSRQDITRVRFIKGFRTKQMDIIFNPYRSLPSILFPQREQLEIFTLLLVITGFLFTGGRGGRRREEERVARFRGLKRGFPGMDENLKFSAITRSSDLFRSSFSIHSFLLVTYVRIKIYELR